MILSFLFSTIPDLAMAYVVMKHLNRESGTFWILFAGMQFLHMLRGIYTIVASSMIFRLTLKSQIREGIYSDLVKNTSPNPQDFRYTLADEHFYGVVNAPDLVVEKRLMVKEILTIIKTMHGEGIQRGLQWNKAAVEVLEKYFKLRFHHVSLVHFSGDTRFRACPSNNYPGSKQVSI